MTARNTDYDAAQALLDLRGTVKPETPGAYMWRASNSREDMEKTETLFWNCFISSEIPVVSVSGSNCHESTSREMSNADCPKALKSLKKYSTAKFKSRFVSNKNETKNYRNFDAKIQDSSTTAKSSQKLSLSDSIGNNIGKNITKTRETGTQTEERYFNPKIEFMENTIKHLCERIKSLESQLKQSNTPDQNSVFVGSENEDIENHSYESQQSMNMSMNESSVKESKTVKYSNRIKYEDSLSDELRHDKVYRFKHKVITNHNSYVKASDSVPIGDGHAVVPARLLKHINWNSYTSATRKLLTAVFTRRILATHSLTGKPSPAFPNKPAKKKLDPVLVNDIVQTVVERCSVPENVVRTSITTKCADESKMFKTRQSNNKRRTSKKNCENVPPTTSESESEDY